MPEHFEEPAPPLPWWVFVLVGLVMAPLMYGVLLALIVIGWWLEVALA